MHPTELTYPCCLPALGELGKMSPRGGLAQSLGEGPPTTQGDPGRGDFTGRSGDGYAPPRRIRLVAYGARLESGLGVKALRGSNPLSSASGKPPLTWAFLVQVRARERLMC